MDKVLEIIKEKKDAYREEKAKLSHDRTIANRLGYEREKVWIQRDIEWVSEILQLLEEIAKEAQPSTTATP